jgi:hypothetical protein
MVAHMRERRFIDRLLSATAQYPKGHFPDYTRWSIEEEIWPTAAVQYGGALYELACFKSWDLQWHFRYKDDPRVHYGGSDLPMWRGRYPRYPIRFVPEVALFETDGESSIVHPCKVADNPLRKYSRQVRDGITVPPPAWYVK